jgi:hypothetical protein
MRSLTVTYEGRCYVLHSEAEIAALCLALSALEQLAA